MVTSSAAYRKNQTLGILFPLFGAYHETIWDGIIQVAKEHDANVLCFVGGSLDDATTFRRHWNAIYELAGPANVDGLIVLSGALQNCVTVEKFTQFCAHYAPLPVVSIALELEGIPSVTVDNPTGLRELLKHLIEHHHYRRIAFIRGPETNQEANIRYHTYGQTLAEYGIPLDPDLVAPGNFIVESGVGAVSLLLDDRGASFDAIVASNDGMAIGAWQELTRRGLNVPEDIALAGFDDIPDARLFTRPLTTVRQPLAEQGRQAARMLLEWLRQGAPPQNAVMGTELIIRDSCGCLPLAAPHVATSAPIVLSDISGDALAHQRDVVLADIQELINPHFPGVLPRSVELLVDAFFDALQGKDPSRFLPLLNRMLRQGARTLEFADLEKGIMSRWQEALSVLREKALPYRQPDVTEDLDGLLYQGGVLINAATRHVHLDLEKEAEISMLAQSWAVRDINTAVNAQQVADLLSQNLSGLGIYTCFLALYEGTPIPPPTSRQIMAYHDGKRLELGPDWRLFPSTQLIPPDTLPHDQWPYLAIYPLVSRDIHFGFIVMEMVAGQWSMYSTYLALAEQIGSALYRALLQQQIEQSNQDLHRRAAELAEANAQLEQFAYVASHDLQEPLRMVTSYLQLIEKRYKDKLDANGEEFIGFAVDGAMRMKRMIDDLLAYSRVSTRSQPLEPTSCEDPLAQALSNLQVAIQESDALITHDPLPTVMADGTQLIAVFQNLISNAVKFRAGRQPHIHISAERQKGAWRFSVRDNGIGIAPEFSERIFAIFSRLHTQVSYPGTGIGLAICKKVIERHGGCIWVESEPGQGSTFFFTVPSIGQE